MNRYQIYLENLSLSSSISGEYPLTVDLGRTTRQPLDLREGARDLTLRHQQVQAPSGYRTSAFVEA